MREIAAILEIISAISSTLALDEILAEFTEKMTQIVGADSCAISKWDHQNDTIVVLVEYILPHILSPTDDFNDIGSAYPLADYPASAQVLQEHVPLTIYRDDPSADEAERELLECFQWDGVLMVPMLYKEQAIGLLELYTDDKERYQFSENDIVLCQILANQAAVAIENARLYKEAEEGRLHAETMQVISRVLASELDYQRIVHEVADFAFHLMNAQFVYVAVPEGDGFRPVAVVGHDKGQEAGLFGRETDPTVKLPGQEILARAVRGPLLVPDVRCDPTSFQDQPKIEDQHWRTMVAVPLLSHHEFLGVLAAYASEPNVFTPNDVAILMSLASQGAVAIQNARLFEKIEAQRQALHHLSLRLVNAQEEERRRISRELHDELGQALTALKINLEVGRRALPSDASPELYQSIQEASSLAIQTLETARSMSLELHPALLDDLGLISALRWEIDRYEQRTSQTVHFKADLAEIILKPELEITIYRIIIEALTNIARHAQATTIAVRLHIEDNHLLAEVEDDGVGFDFRSWAHTITEQQSLGLVGMRERAELLGGNMSVLSRPGDGTRVHVQLPIEE